MQDILKADNLLENAQHFRQTGFEGKARVTARLAVASILNDYYRHEHQAVPEGSAFDLIKSASNSELFPMRQQQILQHLYLKVDESYNLPTEIDLLQEAMEFIQWVKNQLNGAKEKMTDKPEKIKIYATSWCGGSRRARNIFNENHIEYEWIDIDENEEAGKFVESVNRGYRSVPTIVFPDGTILTEPSTADLMKKLGLKLPF